MTRSKTHVAGNELGIYENLAQYYYQDDLDLYYASVAKYIPNGTHPICHGIDGAICPASEPSYDSGEPDLDLQVALPLIYPQQAIIFQTDDAPNEILEYDYDYLGFFNNFFGW